MLGVGSKLSTICFCVLRQVWIIHSSSRQAGGLPVPRPSSPGQRSEVSRKSPELKPAYPGSQPSYLVPCHLGQSVCTPGPSEKQGHWTQTVVLTLGCMKLHKHIRAPDPPTPNRFPRLG